MGRPPIGTVAMTSTERARRHRALHRTDKAVRSEPAEIAPADDQVTDLEAEIDELRRERDQARRELARRDALAQPEPQPKAANPAIAGACFVCRRRSHEAKAMVTASRRGFDLFLCDQCVGEMAEIIAARIRASE